MPDHDSISVLYVDDERSLLEITQLFLGKASGFSVRTTTSGAEALDILSSGRFDAILSDYMMPQMDGIEFLKIIRQQDPEVPFILFTGKGREEIVIQAINNGATFYVQKGGDATAQFTELAHKIRQAVAAARSKEALRQSEMLHRTIFETSPDAITLTNTDGILSYTSPAAISLFGLASEKDALGTPLFDWIVPEMREEVKERFLQFIRSKSPTSPSSLFLLQRKDGTRFHAEISSSVLTGADGEPVGMISILRNVTDRIASDDALRKAGAKLNLLSSVTRHDILNQLTVLIGYIELARRAKDPAAVQDFLRKIDEIAGMLGDQIEFTKDYQELGVHSPCWQCVADIVSRAASGLGTGDVKFVNECGELEVFADPLFVKVVYNLIDNAFRHGGAVSTIRFRYEESGDDLVLVAEDDGEGVRVQDKQKIFSKGFGRNTGFGLFLVREILAITGMSIAETGFPGTGARFEIVVPRGNFRFRNAK
ncbi:MAG: response regulator [Methanoregula sp.]|jgi:PAS domain S-box-containing protein|uniref:ATP-binding response regulator n=1 Tax=Methanoregula sp. TaxID=2052170 RepID=UPI003D0FA32B